MLSRTELTDLIRTLVGREINDLYEEGFADVIPVTNNVFDIKIIPTSGRQVAEWFTVRITQQKRY